VSGNWVAADSGKAFIVRNPANGGSLGTAPSFRADETKRAVESANDAFTRREFTAKKHSDFLGRWFDLCMQHQEDLVGILALEQGKPLVEARNDTAYGASFLQWFTQEARITCRDVIPENAKGRRFKVAAGLAAGTR
jgi:succinate-semialdehyde dehydrogenase / glutarate-semialdehyde dehydrogenase